MTDLNKVTPQQFEQYCTNFHLSPNALPTDIIKSYRSCCDILEIKPGSNSEAIRNAYKRLCKVRHPDRLSGSTEAMQELVKAKEMLSAYIELSDGDCGQPFTSLEITRTTTTTQAIFDGDVRSFSPQRMMSLRVIGVLARQHINIAKFMGKDFFAVQLQAIDEAIRKILERMKELIAFPFQFATRFSIEDVNHGIDGLLNHYDKTNEVGKLIIHRSLSALFMFFTAVKRMNSYFEEILSDQKLFQILELLVKKDALSITQNDNKTASPGLMFFPPLMDKERLDEEKPLLPNIDQPASRDSVSWWRRAFCC